MIIKVFITSVFDNSRFGFLKKKDLKNSKSQLIEVGYTFFASTVGDLLISGLCKTHYDILKYADSFSRF